MAKSSKISLNCQIQSGSRENGGRGGRFVNLVKDSGIFQNFRWQGEF